MKIIPLLGGLGNQMFVYAFYLSMKMNDKNTFCTDCILKKDKAHTGYDLGRAFGIVTDSNLFLDIFVKCMMKMRRRFSPSLFQFVLSLLRIRFLSDVVGGHCDESFLQKNNRFSFFFGYWQSENYFYPYREKICETFRFNIEVLSETTQYFWEEIQKQRESVALHVRRGDFVDADIALLDVYYDKAIDVLYQYVLSPVFYVFSDDMEYAKTLNIPNAVYVDCNKGEDSWQDMFLMSSCRHNIIANSTFSWWGAYLNRNESKVVIAPKEMKVFNQDIFPKGYIVI